VVRARGEVAVWTVGEGEPVLVVHGFPDHPRGIWPTATALARAGFHCVVPALPGYAPSSPAPDYSAEAVGDDLLAVLDALGLDRVALVGHDWGAELGYPLVARTPERFSHFVALAVPHPAGYAKRRASFEELKTAWYAIFLAYAPGAPRVAAQPEWLTALVHSWSPSFHWEDWPAVCEAIGRPGVMEAVCAYYRANLSSLPVRPRLRTPTTVIHGGQDECIHPVVFEDLDEWFEAGMRRHLLPEAGHWPHLERPDETLELILEALP
jgi:pimeloyl-ACP methyl ester carboxylesterase